MPSGRPRQPESTAEPRSHYQPALDGVRALAALAVLGFHLRLRGFIGGSLGVDIFFTLSGFLITTVILREVSATGTLSFRNFYARRALRLLPAYLAVVAVAVLGDLFVVDAGGTLKGAFFSFFYVANWAAGLGGMGLGALAHAWSLSVEEQFYLIWPAVLLFACGLARRKPKLSVLLFVSGLCVAFWAMTAAFVIGPGVTFDVLNNATPFRATELMAGCLLAAAASRGLLSPLRRMPRVSSAIGAVSLAGLLSLVALGRAETNQELLGLWLLASLCTMGVIASTQAPRTIAGSVLSVRPLVQVGKMSYGLYLWHFPVLVSIDALVGLDSLWPRVTGVAVTAVLVVCSYYWLERPFLRLKDRLPGRSGRRHVDAAHETMSAVKPRIAEAEA